jgi:hypothetical protein
LEIKAVVDSLIRRNKLIMHNPFAVKETTLDFRFCWGRASLEISIAYSAALSLDHIEKPNLCPQ